MTKIDLWITHNINYAVKKFQKFDYALVPTKKILKKRKAICTGYSQLFTEMCQAVTIKSVQVPGYTKDYIEHDACDSFYLDDHIWNAVHLDGHWYLLDATWDAGYIITNHITIWSFLRYYLTFKQRWKYVPCHKFIQSPQLNYYLKSGHYFQNDHLPANADWQLTDHYMTALDFLNDSTHYFFKSIDNIYNGHYTTSSREVYANLSRNHQLMEDGFAATEFNPKNQLGAAVGSYLKTNKYMQQLMLAIENKDNSEANRLLDSINLQAKKTIYYCDTNVVLLKEQQNTRCNQVRTKNSIMKLQNRQLRASSNRSLTIKHKLKTQKRSFNQFYKTSKKTASDRIKTMNKDEGIYKSSPAKKRMYTDSLLISFELKSVDSLLELKLKELDETKLLVNQFSMIVAQKLDTHANYSIDKKYISWHSLITRSNGFDNYDFLIRNLKDTLMLIDSVRAFDYKINDRHLLDSMRSVYRLSRTQASEIISLYSKRGSILKRLKTKSCDGWMNIMQLYQDNLMTVAIFTNNYYVWLNSNKRFYASLQRPTRRIVRNSRRTIAYINRENYYTQSTTKIIKKQRSLIKLSDQYKKQAIQQLKDAEKLKKKLGKV
ncbi:MAG: hypothetical protein HYZ42_05250 [Bacteroidetes bacterium]|nr:hypothetical protein [Bacteroidota bacterium]